MSQLPDYYTIWHKAGHYGLRIMAGLVLVFLMLPILVIMPLSSIQILASASLPPARVSFPSSSGRP